MSSKVIGYIYLDEVDVKEIHEDQLAQFGGRSGIRSHDGLASAVGQPEMSFGGDDLYPDAFSKAAILGFCIAEGNLTNLDNRRFEGISPCRQKI